MGRSPILNAEQRAETRAQLIVAGQQVFASHGLAGCTVGQIAAEAGCSKGLLYHYFPSKESLASAVLDEWLSTLKGLAETARAAGDAADQLAAFARAIANLVEANPNGYRLNLRALADPEFREIAGSLANTAGQTEQTWAAAFAQLGSDDPVLDGRLFQTSLLGILAHHVLSPSPTQVTELVDRLISQRLDR